MSRILNVKVEKRCENWNVKNIEKESLGNDEI